MMGKFSKIWRSQNISAITKVKLYETFVISVLLYGSECWCLHKADEKKLLVAEMSWLRRILGVTRRDKMRNESVRIILHQKETVIDKIRRRRMTWFGHVTRMEGNRLPSRAMYCYVEGTRSRGRQPKKWIDNVKEDLKAYNMDIRTAVNLTRDRAQWRHLVGTLSSATG